MTLLVLQSFLLSFQIECRKNCIMWQTQVHVLEGKYLKQSLIRLFRIRLESLDFRLQKRCFTTIEKSVLNCIDVVSVDSLQSYRGLLIAWLIFIEVCNWTAGETAEPKADKCLHLIFHCLTLSAVLQLEKGAYPWKFACCIVIINSVLFNLLIYVFGSLTGLFKSGEVCHWTIQRGLS